MFSSFIVVGFSCSSKVNSGHLSQRPFLNKPQLEKVPMLRQAKRVMLSIFFFIRMRC